MRNKMKKVSISILFHWCVDLYCRKLFVTFILLHKTNKEGEAEDGDKGNEEEGGEETKPEEEEDSEQREEDGGEAAEEEEEEETEKEEQVEAEEETGKTTDKKV